MRGEHTILLFVDDFAVLSSLQFSLSLDGFVVEGWAKGSANPLAVRCLVIDQRYRGDGLTLLQELRAAGATAPAILLATDPTRRLRQRAATAGAVVVEKPVLGDELVQALLSCAKAMPLRSQN